MTYEECKQKIKDMGYIVRDDGGTITVGFWNENKKKELIVWFANSRNVDITGFDNLENLPVYEAWKEMINSYMVEHGMQHQNSVKR